MLTVIDAELLIAKRPQRSALEANREDQVKKQRDLQDKIAVVSDAVDNLDKHLKFPGFSPQRAEKSINIWTADSLGKAIPEWGRMFTTDHLAKIRPFLWWKEDDNLDQQLAKLEKAPSTPKPQPELIEKKLATLKGDLDGLSPFQLVVKSPTSEASMPLVKINVPAPKTDTAPPSK